MLPYKEEWCVMINRKATILNEIEKSKLELAMKNGDRWFKTEKGDILSVSHIESVTLNYRENKNQIEAPKEEKPTQEEMERAEEIKKQIREKVKFM